MKKLTLVLTVSVFFLTGMALADSPQGPTPPGGWGTDCTNWITYSDPWDSGMMIYDPTYSGGDGFMVCPECDPVVWPGLDIELWIEMECTFTWDRTHAQIHRVGDYSDFYLYFNGTSSCNNGQYVITTPPTSLASLAYLPFVQDMFGRTTGDDIPLTWEYSVDGGAWGPMIDLADPPGSKYFLVESCDHYFTIRVLVDLAYHQGDGYYYLGGEGASICPATPM